MESFLLGLNIANRILRSLCLKWPEDILEEDTKQPLAMMFPSFWLIITNQSDLVSRQRRIPRVLHLHFKQAFQISAPRCPVGCHKSRYGTSGAVRYQYNDYHEPAQPAAVTQPLHSPWVDTEAFMLLQMLSKHRPWQKHDSGIYFKACLPWLGRAAKDKHLQMIAVTLGNNPSVQTDYFLVFMILS